MERKTSKKRRRLGEKAWRELIERCEAAGSPVREFCQREGLSISSFQRWRSRLGPHVPAAGVIEGSRADVSFIAGVLVDKFAWHLPLYRQHQRLQAAGFKVSRQWLTQLVQQGAQLLQPIYGEHDEVCFPFFESRRHKHVQQALGLKQDSEAVLLSDGYEALRAQGRRDARSMLGALQT